MMNRIMMRKNKSRKNKKKMMIRRITNNNNRKRKREKKPLLRKKQLQQRVPKNQLKRVRRQPRLKRQSKSPNQQHQSPNHHPASNQRTKRRKTSYQGIFLFIQPKIPNSRWRRRSQSLLHKLVPAKSKIRNGKKILSWVRIAWKRRSKQTRKRTCQEKMRMRSKLYKLFLLHLT